MAPRETVNMHTSSSTNYELGNDDANSTPSASAAPSTEPWTVETALRAIGATKLVEGSTSPLPYFHLLEQLKTTKREGWRRFNMETGESIADHMYRMSLMSMLAPPTLAPRLDLAKCMQMCLIHDMAESLVGDITPVDGVPKAEKHRREAATMDYITRRLLGNVYGGQGAVGDRVRAIWHEYEDNQTLESHYVHDIDKLELLLQMLEYEKRHGGQLDLGEFVYVSTLMMLPEMSTLAQGILRERDEFWAEQRKAGREPASGPGGEDGLRPDEQANYLGGHDEGNKKT